MRSLKRVLVWLGIRCLNLRFDAGVYLVSLLFSLSAELRAA